MPTPIFHGKIENRKLKLDLRDRFQEWLDQLDGREISLWIKPRRKVRTLSQNAYYWVVLEIISKSTGHTPEELHEIFKRSFLPPRITVWRGKNIYMPKTTTILTKSEFGEYLEKIIREAAEMSIVIPPPDNVI